MKKKVIAFLLALVLTSGSVGTVPVMAAETTEQEGEQVQEEVDTVVGKEEDSEEADESATVMEASEEEPASAGTSGEAVAEETLQDTEEVKENTENDEEQIAEDDNTTYNATADEENDSEGDVSAEVVYEDEGIEREEPVDASDASIKGMTETNEQGTPIIDGTDEDPTVTEKKNNAISKKIKMSSSRVYAGDCGENAEYIITGKEGNYTLTIRGSGEMYDYSKRGGMTFSGISTGEIRSIVIEPGITSIGDDAFSYFSAVSSISFPEGLQEIGSHAFYHCSGLNSVILKRGLTQIGDSAFESCRSIENLTLPNGLEQICNSAFSGCNSLSNILIPESVTQIGSGAFSGCSITNIVLPDGLTVVEDGVFSNCSQLNDVVIPNSVTKIGIQAFSACTSLSAIEIPDGVTSIDTQAFYTCSNLEEIELPEALTTIGYGAFWGCRKLTEVIIPENVNTIYKYAFEFVNPNTITIYGNVTDIDEDAFSCKQADIYTVKGCTADQYFIQKNDGTNYVFTMHYLYDPSSGEYSESEVEERAAIYPNCKKIVLKNGDIVDISNYLDIIDKSYLSSMTVSNYDEDLLLYDNGKLAALSEGSTSITITCGEEILTIPIIVVENTEPIARIEFGSDKLSMYHGEIKNILLNIYPENAGFTTIEWSSSNSDVVKINSNGLVQAFENGTATITATAGSLSASCEITVTKKPERIISSDELTIEKGESQRMYYCLHPAGSADSSPYLFESEDTNIVEVSKSGIITAKSPGSTNVIITKGDLTKTVKITVQATLKGITINPTSVQIIKDKSAQLEIVYNPEDTTSDKTVHWSSSNEEIVTVDEQGRITAHEKGIATITAEVGDCTANSSVVCIYRPLTGIELPGSVTVEYGEEVTPILSFVPENTTDDKTVTWESSDTSIFTVSEDGTITPAGIGTATLTATVGEITATSGITIIKGTPAYEMPEIIEAHCGQKLADLLLPEGFEWANSEQSVGKVGLNKFSATYLPNDTDHYNSIENIEVSVSVSHDFSEDWIKDESNHWHECYCGEKNNLATHSYEEWEVTTEPTCVKTGEKEHTCRVCGYTEKETLSALGHSWDTDYTVDKEASCTEEGSESIHCNVCDLINETTVRAISKKEHLYTDWTVTKEATCTESGTKEKTCVDCGDKITEVVPAKGHSYSDWEITKEASCTESGSKEKICADCGDKITEEIPAKGHTWDEEYSIDKEATCTEEGSESIHCSACDAVDEGTVRVIPKTEHNYGNWAETKKATCTEDGIREKICAYCEDKITEVIPAKGHSYSDWTVTKEATCTEDGSKEKVCADCGDKVTEVIAATGHVWKDDYTVDKEAACTEEGSESIHCSVCDAIDEETVRVIPKKDHAFGDWTVTKKATCTEAGTKEKVCSECGDKVVETIPATGHVQGKEYTVDKEAAIGEEGSESIHCSVCGEIIESTVRPIPALTAGWIEDKNGWKYLKSDGTYPKSKFEVIDGKTYYFNDSEYRVTGLQTIENKKYYFNNDGVMQTGWQTIADEKYYFDNDGAAHIGWLQYGGKWYYFRLTGVMHTGTLYKAGKYYYLRKDGTRLSGWLMVGGKTYYHKLNGERHFGWLKVNGNYYYFKTNGEMHTGWLRQNGNYYYFKTSGQMHKGWLKLNGKYYYFKTNGQMHTGTLYKDGKYYYLRKDGTRLSGWLKVSGKTYYHKLNGERHFGWLKVNGKYYYFKTNGQMVTGRYKIGNRWYTFNKNGVRQ